MPEWCIAWWQAAIGILDGERSVPTGFVLAVYVPLYVFWLAIALFMLAAGVSFIIEVEAEGIAETCTASFSRRYHRLNRRWGRWPALMGLCGSTVPVGAAQGKMFPGISTWSHSPGLPSSWSPATSYRH